MLARVVQYLHANAAPFRLFSHPSPEPLPEVAYRPPPGAVHIATHVLLIGGRAAIACTHQGAKLSLPELSRGFGAVVAPGSAQDLPAPFTGATGPIPPLGRAMGLFTVVDEAVTRSSAIVFEAFSGTDIVEMPYDDFARLESPRIASFATGGELPVGTHEAEPEKRSA
jgi:prolyl-tRNA editing enzyme YbaK/EbsC (Cys-tRNA(Pro) deacylase)